MYSGYRSYEGGKKAKPLSKLLEDEEFENLFRDYTERIVNFEGEQNA